MYTEMKATRCVKIFSILLKNIKPLVDEESARTSFIKHKNILRNSCIMHNIHLMSD